MKKIIWTLLLGASVAAQAHNVWLDKTDTAGEYVVSFGHESTETYPESKLTAVQQLDSQGKLSALLFVYREGEAYVQPQEASMVFLQFDNGVWSKLPSGKYVEKTKQQEPSAEFSINPLKLGKNILRWDAQATLPHAMDYELIPQAAPQAGKPLAILVLHHGKPLAGIKVGLGEDKPFNLTDSNGIASFTPTAGYNKVWAEFAETVADNPDFDRRTIEYLLTFDVPAR